MSGNPSRHQRAVSARAPGLVADYRFEEGAGTLVADSSAAGSPDGTLVAGVPGNGEWVSWAADPANTAPILPADGILFTDGFESGGTGAWSSTVE